ncbi:MAG: nitrous oxide reductase accessory protein NosL [Gemmatimonadaceae bacterium]|nr:nitrous oxide reductase accessory protein NosL [Gemmatimonadaceae bacterium]
MRTWTSVPGAILLALSIGACDSGPRALIAGEDACRYCRMTIDDPRFGAIVMTSHGKIETFDSIECLASFVAGLPATAPAKGIWVADFEHPSHWIDVHTAKFLHRSRLRSPMGRELAAFDVAASPDSLRQAYGGTVLDWPAAQNVVRQSAFAPTGAPVDLTISGAGAAAATPAHTH